MSKWIDFIELEASPTRKTKIFTVRTNDGMDILGQIKWFGSFRQYAFFPEYLTIYEKTCLKDIADFMEHLMEERKLIKNGKSISK